MSNELKKQHEITSEKYKINGIINDYGLVIKLRFDYQGKQIEIGLERPFGEKDCLVSLGQKTIDSYVDNLLTDKNRCLMLHYWYIDEAPSENSAIWAYGM